jgi:hypothetical protein
MGAVTDDPVLDRLSEMDPDAYRAVVAELIVALPGSMAGYSGLSLDDMTALSTHTREDVRAKVAERPDCPASLLEALAHDSHSSVRKSVAGNATAPAEAIRTLAADPDYGVRWQVARRADVGELGLWEQLASDPEDFVQEAIAENPACPQPVLLQLAITAEFEVPQRIWSNPALTEEVRAALVLSGTDAPDDYRIIQAWRASGVLPTDHHELETLAEHRDLDVDALRDIFQAIGDFDYSIRSELAQHPAADEALLAQLVQSANYRSEYRYEYRNEWRNLWGRYFPDAWPSTEAMNSAKTTSAARAALNAAGHPAGLISIDMPAVPCSTSPAEALAQLIRSELLVRALWRELVLAGTLSITAWNDGLTGERFFLDIPGEDAGESPTGLMLGGYSVDREWAHVQNYLSKDDAQPALSKMGGEWEFEGVDDWQLDEAMCACISFAADETEDLTITGQGAAFIFEVAVGMDDDPYDMSIQVTIVESKLPHIGYGGLDPKKKEMLVDLLIASREHVLMREWGLADHLLSCVEHHLETPEDLRIRIAASSGDKVG